MKMREKKTVRPIGIRVLAFFLAFVMVFTSVSVTDLGSMEVKAAETVEYEWFDAEETGTYKYLDILDGEITAQDLYDALYAQSDFYGEPDPKNATSTDNVLTYNFWGREGTYTHTTSTEGGYEISDSEGNLLSYAREVDDVTNNLNVDETSSKTDSSVH